MISEEKRRQQRSRRNGKKGSRRVDGDNSI